MTRRSSARAARRRGRGGLACALLVLSAFLLGCRPEVEDEKWSPGEPTTYTVRGEITQLPEEGDAIRRIFVRHEAIEEFVNRQGEVVGMASMNMPFPVAAEVVVEGYEVGNKVEIAFRVDWDATPVYEIVTMRPLSDDTVLELDER